MLVTTKNNRQVFLRKLNSNDIDKLFDYLQHLRLETKKRFEPHSFDKQSIVQFHQNSGINLGYIALDIETTEIIAYSVIKIGYLEHDGIRLQSYGITPNKTTDCTFAPSVADLWQGYGIGNCLFNFILADLKLLNIKRIILWGGVQTDNDIAVNFYKKTGFTTSGQFYHNGENYDMFFDIS